jgi:hypothetical protein
MRYRINQPVSFNLQSKVPLHIPYKAPVLITVDRPLMQMGE